MVLDRLAMPVVALLVLANSSAVSVSVGGWMVFVLLLKTAKMMWNLARLVSALDTDVFRVGLRLVGVRSFVAESIVRTD